MLLVGPPGTGKTLLARAVAGEAKVPFFSLSGSEFVEMFVGVGAARVRDLFRQAEAKAPCIVFIDELDALGKVRMQSPMGGHEEREQTLNQLLSEMDGFDVEEGRHHHGRDQPARSARPGAAPARAASIGRCSSTSRTSRAARRSCASTREQVKLGDERRSGGDRRAHGRIRRRRPGESRERGGAARGAARQDARSSRRDFDEAIDRVIAGLEKKRVMNPRERRIVAFHESGHAIVATVLPGLDPVHKVSIVAARLRRARLHDAAAARGSLSDDAEPSWRTSWRCCSAGRTAELLVFGEVSTGAQNDLLRATDIARAMVTEFGMSEAIGPVNHEGRRRSTFLDTPFMPERGAYAEETARVIDAEVRRIVMSAETSARNILEARHDNLLKLAEKLLEQEVVDGDQVRDMLNVAGEYRRRQRRPSGGRHPGLPRRSPKGDRRGWPRQPE